VLAWLQPNTNLMDEYEVDRRAAVLTATGYHRVSVFATGGSVSAADRNITIDPGSGRGGSVGAGAGGHGGR